MINREAQVNDLIHDKQQVKLKLEQDAREYVGIFKSCNDKTATFQQTNGSDIVIVLEDIIDMQIIGIIS